MPRPRIIVPSSMLRDAYESGGSLRTASSSLRLSRWAFRERCEELGVKVLDRDEVRRRKSVTTTPAGERVFTERRRSRVVGGRGSTVVTRIERRSYEPCAWPSCSTRRRHDALCGEHHRRIFGPRGQIRQTCEWPECRQDRVLFTRACGYHVKVAAGLIEVGS